jgi:hypothetical protein
VTPGGLADRLEDGVDAGGQPGAGLEDLVRTELERPPALGLVAARSPTRPARRRGRGRWPRSRPAAGALHQHAVTGRTPAWVNSIR